MIDRQKLQREIFAKHLDDVHRRRDRVFAWLMAAQWMFGVALAMIYSPYGWEGKVQSTHLHVWYAVFVGGCLSGPSILLAVFRPGWVITRHWIAVAQMLWSALFIHLTGGRIETHFHVFGSLAFLAFYRDWRVLITATLAVSFDHLTRGLLWPESVYGITNPEWWRFLEHAFWVVFENIVLVMGILESHREMRELAVRQTDLEERVQIRTHELVAAKREVSDILDNMGQAIFTVGGDGKVDREFSAHCRAVFGTGDLAGRTPSDLLGVELQGWMSTVIGADELQWKLCESDPPAEIRHRERIVELAYAPIYQRGVVDRVMFVCRDVTELRQLSEEVQRKEEENRTLVERVARVAALDPVLLAAFLEEANAQIAEVQQAMANRDRGAPMDGALRALHTLKGNARAYGLGAIAYAVHAAEQALNQADVEQVVRLVAEFDHLAREVLSKRTGAADRQRLTPIVENARYLAANLERGLAGVAPEQRVRLEQLVRSVIELPLVPFSALVPRLEGVANDVASRAGKPAPDLHASLDGLLVDAPMLEKLSGVLTQLVRNAIDHGIEQPPQRLYAQKNERGRLRLAALVEGDHLQLHVEDDGRGIDADRIREIAIRRRLISETDEEMHDDQAAMQLLFAPGFTTASNVTEISGRGVGLDVVRSAVRALGGEVGIRSHAGRGTTFMVSLPKSCATVARATSG